MDDDLRRREVEALEKLAGKLGQYERTLEEIVSYVRDEKRAGEEKARRRIEKYRVKTDAEVEKEACELLQKMLLDAAKEIEDGE